MNEIVEKLLLSLSGIFMFVGAVGLFRFRDFYLKVHSATMITVGGVVLSLILLSFDAIAPIKLKVTALVLIMLLTSPVSTHFIALAAYKSKVGMEVRERVVIND